MTYYMPDKDPAAVLDYIWDWTSWLAIGETISAQSVTPDTGITVASSSLSGGQVTAWISGGTAGQSYTVTCQITTNLGRTDERSVEIKIVNR